MKNHNSFFYDYGEAESFRKEIDAWKNNLKKSLLMDVNKHTPLQYSMCTNFTYDDSEDKHFDRGPGCIEKIVCCK